MFSIPSKFECFTCEYNLVVRTHPLAGARQTVRRVEVMYFDRIGYESSKNKTPNVYDNVARKGWKMWGMTEHERWVLQAPDSLRTPSGQPLGVIVDMAHLAGLISTGNLEDQELIFIEADNDTVLVKVSDLELDAMRKLRRAENAVKASSLNQSHLGMVINLRTSQKGEDVFLCNVEAERHLRNKQVFTVLNSKGEIRTMNAEYVELYPDVVKFTPKELSAFLTCVSDGGKDAETGEYEIMPSAEDAVLNETFMSKYLTISKSFTVKVNDTKLDSDKRYEHYNPRVLGVRSQPLTLPQVSLKKGTSVIADSTVAEAGPSPGVRGITIQRVRNDFKLTLLGTSLPGINSMVDTDTVLTFSNLEDLFDALYKICAQNNLLVQSRRLLTGEYLAVIARNFY